MIKNVHMANWKRHHDCTFTFRNGLNLIRGENEAGKSIILEAIDFAIHGSVALRLEVGRYPKNLQSTVELTIRGVDYKVERTLKTAKLYQGDNLIAVGTKPVNAEFTKLFGYNRNVFMVANFSSQDSINYLSSLKPTERKRTIDNVVGLSAVEAVIAECKEELTILNRLAANHRRQEPIGIAIEPLVALPENWEEKRDQLKLERDEIVNKCNKVQSQLSQHDQLDLTKPVMTQFSEEDRGKEIPNITDEDIQKHDQIFAVLNANIVRLNEKLIKLNNNAMMKPVEPITDRIIEGLTIQAAFDGMQTHAKLVTKVNTYKQIMDKTPPLDTLATYSDEDIEATKKQEALYADWLEVQRSKSLGAITCPHCTTNFLLEHDRLTTQFKHVPEVVEKPEISSTTMEKTKHHYETVKAQYDTAKTQWELATDELADFDQRWYSQVALDLHIEQVKALEKYQTVSLPAYQAFLADYEQTQSELDAENQKMCDALVDWYSPSELEQHSKYLNVKRLIELENAAKNQWLLLKSQLPSVEELQSQSDTLTNQLETIEGELTELTQVINQWNQYANEKKVYDAWDAENDRLNFDVEQESNKIKTLQAFKNNVKSTILPSVNAVASTWVRRMSEDMHFSASLTDNMDILVDDEPIEALSISGRALGHLSLRMALGQVLTNSVFPVFIADEVDSSMRNNRSQNVLDALVDMLNGSMKQLIVISHNKIDASAHVIEV